MSILETVGMVWIIFTCVLGSAVVIGCALVGFRVTLNKRETAQESVVPVEVKEMFKIAR